MKDYLKEQLGLLIDDAYDNDLNFNNCDKTSFQRCYDKDDLKAILLDVLKEQHSFNCSYVVTENDGYLRGLTCALAILRHNDLNNAEQSLRCAINQAKILKDGV
jgi:hypothetical protein